jgi:DNA-binding Lrp family transcriptional regulator
MDLGKTGLIDDVDTKIIGYLLENARKSFVEIGKEIGVSKNVVWSRYQRMVGAGIITGATVQINYKRLGYDCVSSLLLDVDQSKIEQVSNYLKARVPDIFGPYPRASKYNLVAVLTLKTMSELGILKEELRRKLAIEEINSSLWTDVWFTPENLTLIPVRPIKSPIRQLITNGMFDADETDLKIIRELTKDSRISFRTLAKQSGLSTDTIARRYYRLIKNSIIVARIQIDPAKIGYQATAHFFLRFLPNQDPDTIINQIIKIPDVFYIMKCTGEYNLGVMMMAKDIQNILKTGDTISLISGVKRLETVTSKTGDKWPGARTYTSTLSRNLI